MKTRGQISVIFVRTRPDGLFNTTERYTNKDDVTYMWDCIPDTFVGEGKK